MKSRKSLFVLLTIFVVVGGIVAWRTIAGRGFESTDNAQLEAEIVPVPARIGGPLTEVRFTDNQRVEAGDILAVIDDGPLKARLAQAEASVKAAEAQAAAADADAKVSSTNASGNRDVAEAGKVTAESGVAAAKTQLREAEATVRSAQASYAQAKADKDRDTELHTGGVVSDAQLQSTTTRANVAASQLEAAKAHLGTLRATIDQAESRIGEATARVDQTKDIDQIEAQAQAKAAAAHAQVEVAKAARDAAALDVSYTVIRASHAGVLSKKSVAVGQMVAPGQAIAQLVTDGLWVTANFKETQLEKMTPGQKVKVEVDAFPNADIEGVVESLAGATGARFSLLPPDNATGNYTKVVQRLPVRVKIMRSGDAALKPGLSVSVTVDTRTAGEPVKAAETTASHP